MSLDYSDRFRRSGDRQEIRANYETLRTNIQPTGVLPEKKWADMGGNDGFGIFLGKMYRFAVENDLVTLIAFLAGIGGGAGGAALGWYLGKKYGGIQSAERIIKSIESKISTPRIKMPSVWDMPIRPPPSIEKIRNDLKTFLKK